MGKMNLLKAKNSQIILRLLFVIIFGFLFSFFYQLFLKADFSKIDFKVLLSPSLELVERERVTLLSGWKKSSDKDSLSALWSDGKVSSIALILPRKNAFQMEVEIYMPQRKLIGGLIEAYVNKKLLSMFRVSEFNKWKKCSFIIPSEIISEGFNKISFVNLSQKPESIGFRYLRLANYKKMPWSFPGGNVLFDPVRWFPKKQDINWRYCFLMALILPAIWLVWSLWLFFNSDQSFSEISKLGFFAYLPSICILIFLYLFSRIFLINLVLSKFDLLLFTVFLITCCKFIFVLRYAKKNKSKNHIFNLVNLLKIFSNLTLEKTVLGRQVPRAIRVIKFISKKISMLFIIGFIILLFACTFFAITHKCKIAEQSAIWAYISLAIGLFLRLINFLRIKTFGARRPLALSKYTKNVSWWSKFISIKISILFIIGFIILLFACAFLTMMHKGKMAEQSAIWAYISLVVGLFLELINL